MLVDSPVVATLAGLLSHDNTDIAMEVMDLLQELTDAGGHRLRKKTRATFSQLDAAATLTWCQPRACPSPPEG